jgi:hypothetical protein
MRKSFLPISSLSLFAIFALAITPVSAHPPNDMTLDYDFDNQILTVTVLHAVADPNTHYIERIIIEKNSVFTMDRNYTSQASSSSMADAFNINAVNNDILQVTAICSISGQIVRQITVSSGGLQTQPRPSIPGFPLAAIAISLMLAIGLALIRHRRLSTP